jgi:hypothetical protein
VDARIKSAHDAGGCFSALILFTSFSVRLLDELVLAYATTIHTSQGAEYQAVPLTTHTDSVLHGMMFLIEISSNGRSLHLEPGEKLRASRHEKVSRRCRKAQG